MASLDLDAHLQDLEQLVWEDIQSEGLDWPSQDEGGQEAGKPAGLVEGGEPFAVQDQQRACSSSSPVSSMTGLPLQSAAGDAGSGASLATTAEGVAANRSLQPSCDQAEEVGPFASLGAHQRLDSAPLGGLHPAAPHQLEPNRSLVTHKTRALAAAAGSLRSGPVGSGLRFAAFMARSNSGGLADTLLAEHARAASGLLPEGLGRCDSLPELSLAPSAADLAELVSLRDLDFLAGMPSSTGMPSLSMLFSKRPDFAASAPATTPAVDAAADGQQAQADALAAAINDSVLQAAAAAAGGAEADPMDAPAWSGSRIVGRPASFTATGTAALFSAGSLSLTRPTLCSLPHQEAAAAAPAASQGLKPPSLVDYSQLIMAREQPPAAAAAAAAAVAPVPAGMAAAAAAGFEGFSLPSFGRGPSFGRALAPLAMERQGTFDHLIRQVDQELLAEAEVKQYAALEIGTIDVPLGAPQAQAQAQALALALAAQQPGASAAGLAAAPDSAATLPGVKRRSAFELKRPSVFEGQTALLPADASAAPAGAPAVLEPVGPSFQSWVVPSTSSAASGGSMVAARGPVPGTGAVPTAASPFCLPVGTALLAAADKSTASGDEAATLGKQEVARYSRLITCKTYLKRLNITQPMAEHLLPLHDLTPPAKAPASSDGGASDGDGDAAPKQRGSYDQLFKDQIVLVDEAGGTYRVQYEGVACNAQKHLRLTCGWRDYIRAHNVEVGDTVVFERRGEERSVIYVTLVKAGEAPVDVGPPLKKRRVSRKQAVQRLD